MSSSDNTIHKMQFKHRGNIILKKGKDQKENSFDKYLEKKYGKPGTKARRDSDTEFESFNFGYIVKEARMFKELTQEELAKKSGTTKFYISRVENNACDLRLSTMLRIVYDGLGSKLGFATDF